jgi:hypothetical protein
MNGLTAASTKGAKGTRLIFDSGELLRANIPLSISRKKKNMQASIGSIRRPLLCTFYALLLCIAALCAMPRTAHAQLYVLDSNNTISTHNDTTGAVLNPGFITGLSGPERFALSSNVLFRGEQRGTPGTGTVSEYNTTTGAIVSANLTTTTATQQFA